MTICEPGRDPSECIISLDKSLIFLPEYQVPPDPQPWDWIGGIFNVRTACNIADLNENRGVNLADYVIFAQQWLKTDGNLVGDFDDSGQVDWFDLKIFTNNWLWNADWYTP